MLFEQCQQTFSPDLWRIYGTSILTFPCKLTLYIANNINIAVLQRKSNKGSRSVFFSSTMHSSSSRSPKTWKREQNKDVRVHSNLLRCPPLRTRRAKLLFPKNDDFFGVLEFQPRQNKWGAHGRRRRGWLGAVFFSQKLIEADILTTTVSVNRSLIEAVVVAAPRVP